MSILRTLACKSATNQSLLAGSLLPDMHISSDLSLPYRVYVLRCAPQILGGPFTYYCGLTEDIVARLAEHENGTGAAFTDGNKPLDLVYLWPAANRAVEAYVFAAMMTVLPEEAIAGSRLGGWIQTSASAKSSSASQMVEQWRMVNNVCLRCSKPGHQARNCKSAAASMARAPILPTAVAKGPVRNATIPPIEAASGRSAPKSSPQSDDAKFDAFCRRYSLECEEAEWMPLPPFVAALGESKGHVERYVDPASDSPKKLWLLGPRKIRKPCEGRDWKKAHSKRGGGGGKGVYYCKKTFLKQVLLERYPHKA